MAKLILNYLGKLKSANVNGLRLQHAFVTCSHSRALELGPHIHPFIRWVRVKYLAQGHPDSKLEGAGHRTSNHFLLDILSLRPPSSLKPKVVL